MTLIDKLKRKYKKIAKYDAENDAWDSYRAGERTVAEKIVKDLEELERIYPETI